jgi:hypothetical protein
MYRYYSTVGYFRPAAAGGKSIRNCGVIHTLSNLINGIRGTELCVL